MPKNFSALKSSPYFSLIRDLFWTTFIVGLVSVINYLFNIYVARKFPESSFSVFSAIVGLIYLIQIPAATLQTSITKVVAEHREEDLSSFIAKNIKRFTLIGLLFSLLPIFSANTLGDMINVPAEYIYLLSVLLFVFILSPAVKGILLGYQYIQSVNLVALGETVLKMLILLVGVRYTFDPSLPILAYGVPVLLSTFLLLPFLKVQKGALVSSLDINFRETFLILVSYALYNLFFTVDVLLIDSTLRAEYAAMSLLGKIVYFGATLTSTALFAHLVKEKNERLRRRFLYLGCALNSLICLGIAAVYYLFDSQIVNIVFQGKYLGIAQFIPVVAIAMLLYSVVYLLIAYFIAIGKYWHIGVLLLTAILQWILFAWDNSSLRIAVQNQVIVYLTLFALSGIIFLAIRRKQKLYR